MTNNSKLIGFINALPKTEHHLHMEGSTPWEIMQADNRELFKKPPQSWKDDFRFKDFSEFENLIVKNVVPWLNSPERYGITAREILTKRMQENVRYAEISYSALAIERSGVDLKEVAIAIKEAIPAGIETRLFIGLHHNSLETNHEKYLADILESLHIDGIDLHGPERFPLQDWIKEFWREAKLAGKLVKAHAGELTGAIGVREAIQELGVTKIQHGIQVMEDETTLSMAVAEGASFDVCPISNVKLKAVPSMAEHPIMKLEKAGIRCTINTDDPHIFGNSLKDDYLAVSKKLGATPTQLAEFAKNGFETSQMDEVSKHSAIAEIDALVQQYLSDQN